MTVKPRLLDQACAKIRTKRSSIRTEQAYLAWSKRHPEAMGRMEIESFLAHLTVDRNVAASTQNQTLNALLFLYKEVLGLARGMEHVTSAKHPARLPVVPIAGETRSVSARLDGQHWFEERKGGWIYLTVEKSTQNKSFPFPPIPFSPSPTTWISRTTAPRNSWPSRT